jgi:hypothetical protein
MVSTGFRLERLPVIEDRMAERSRTVSPLAGSLSFPLLNVYASIPTCFSSSEEEEVGKSEEEEEDEECFDFFPFFFLCFEDTTFFLL